LIPISDVQAQVRASINQVWHAFGSGGAVEFNGMNTITPNDVDSFAVVAIAIELMRLKS